MSKKSTPKGITIIQIKKHIDGLNNIFKCGIYQPSKWQSLRAHGERFIKESLKIRPKSIVPKKGSKFSDTMIKFQIYRVLMGIGCELILKAAFVKKRYTINKFRSGKPNRMERWNRNIPSQLIDYQTVPSSILLQNIYRLFPKFGKKLCNEYVRKGFETARIWRNKEVHTGGGYHRQIGTDNYDIANSLTNVYDTVFNDAQRIKRLFRKHDFPSII